MSSLRKDIHMLGDSTMCFYTNDRKPRTGWGMKLQPLCHDDIRVRNYAMAGYSTRNFQNTGYFDLVLKSLRPHDHVIIQFGHNDKHPADFRPLAHTDLNEFTDNLSSWISQIRQLGGIPVLCTTTIEWAEDGLHEKSALLAKYNAATLECAAACGADAVDIYGFAYENLRKLPLTEIWQYHMATSGIADSKNDYCHLKENGAELYAGWFVELVKRKNLAIAECFK